MQKLHKPILFYCIFAFSSLGVLVDILEQKWWPLIIWIPLSIGMGLLIRRWNSIRDSQNLKESDSIATFKSKYLLALSDKTNVEIHINNDELNSSLGLSNQEVKIIDEKARKSCLDDIVRNSITNDTLSPNDYEYIMNSAKRLKVDLSFDKQTSTYLNKLRQYWEIENNSLPIQSVNIALQNGEICYFQTSCKWFEHRIVTKSIAYSGFTTSFKIAKGIRYRVGNIKPTRITEDKLVEIDNGNLFVTSKRIIFMGSKKNTNIKYANVLSIIPYTNGVSIEKDSGKSPTLICSNSDILARILTRLNN